MKYAPVVLVPCLALACTGQFGDASGLPPPPGSSSTASDDASSSPSPTMDASTSTGQTEASSQVGMPDSSSSSPSSSDAGNTDPASIDSSSGFACETTMDSYGYKQCACMEGPVTPGQAVASCTGYDCCVRYEPDSGLAEGFGNPTLSSDLCACYSSADIAAILGGTVSCRQFANGGGGMIVSSCTP